MVFYSRKNKVCSSKFVFRFIANTPAHKKKNWDNAKNFVAQAISLELLLLWDSIEIEQLWHDSICTTNVSSIFRNRPPNSGTYDKSRLSHISIHSLRVFV